MATSWPRVPPLFLHHVFFEMHVKTHGFRQIDPPMATSYRSSSILLIPPPHPSSSSLSKGSTTQGPLTSYEDTTIRGTTEKHRETQGNTEKGKGTQRNTKKHRERERNTDKRVHQRWSASRGRRQWRRPINKHCQPTQRKEGKRLHIENHEDMNWRSISHFPFCCRIHPNRFARIPPTRTLGNLEPHRKITKTRVLRSKIKNL